ncbi:MAG: chemotaxis protein CheX [Acidobacteria bacterium]|nr:chemotaxis protein CheX [Acidobacteriaceae bacterium]MBV9610395.1 chemotaxis protein CheX [Acidobacteriota bacterium]
MKMDLIQPFINAADAVLAETLHGPAHMFDVSMDEFAYRRKGVAAMVQIEGQIEGRIIFDAESKTAAAIARELWAGETASGELVHEALFELANLVIGNAVTTLNDEGFHFRVRPPQLHGAEEGAGASEETEAVVMCFDSPKGRIFLNIAMHYNSLHTDTPAVTSR